MLTLKCEYLLLGSCFRGLGIPDEVCLISTQWHTHEREARLRVGGTRSMPHREINLYTLHTHK